MVILMERQRLKDLPGRRRPCTAGQILRYAQDDGLAPLEGHAAYRTEVGQWGRYWVYFFT
jgi:hypothetical protein